MESNRENRINIYLFKTDQCSHAEMSSFSRAKVVSLAAMDLSVSEKDIEIKTDVYGKPYITGYEQWHFSITHTAGMIGIAVSDEQVGIDVEKIHSADLRIAKRFFTDQEYLRIENSENKDRCFFEIWTKKEAYLKYTGKGLRTPLRCFDVFELAHKFESFEEDGYMYSVCHNRINDTVVSIKCYDLTKNRYK